MEKFDGKLAVFAMGGLEAGKAISLLRKSEISKSKPPGLPSGLFARISKESSIIMVLIVLSPILLITSIFIGVNSLFSRAFKQERKGFPGDKLNWDKINSMPYPANSSSYTDMDSIELRRYNCLPGNHGSTYSWRIEPKNIIDRLKTGNDRGPLMIENRSGKDESLFFLKTFGLIEKEKWN